MAYKKRASYRDHQSALQKLQGLLGSDHAPRLIVLFGSSEYLLGHALRLVRDKLAAKANAPVSALEAGTLNEASLAALFEQGSLFEPASTYVVRRCEQAKTLPKLLKGIATPKSSGNTVIFILQADSIPAALQTELTRLKAISVPCFDPWPNELPPIITTIAAANGMAFKPDAVSLLTEVNGPDLSKLGNEIQKLSLIFPTTKAPLSAKDIAPHLGMLREDDVFELDRLLLAQQWARAQALLTALLERGEKGIALLGILANHCRNGARIAEALRLGQSPAEIATQLRLPPFILKTYLQAVSRTSGARYARALRECRECDLLLKTSAMREDLILSRVIDALAEVTATP